MTDDGMSDVTDGIQILTFVVHGTPVPADPYPAVGPDPDGVHLGCDSYGGGAPLEDPAAVMALGSAAIHGGAPRRVLISVTLTHSTAIAGYMGTLVDESGVLEEQPAGTGNYGDALMDLPGFLDGGYVGGQRTGNRISFGFLSSFTGRLSLEPRVDDEVLRIPVCVKAGTPPGTYPLTLETAELVDFESGRAIHPALESGTLMVDAEVLATPCDVEDSGQGSLFRLEDVVASPGTEVSVPLLLTTDRSLRGIQFSVDFDESLLEATGVDATWARPDGQPHVIAVHTLHNGDVNPGNDPATEGSVGGFYLATLTSEPALIPIDEELSFVTLRFLVKPDAPLGPTELRFVGTGPDAPGAPSSPPVIDACNPAGCTARDITCTGECWFFDYYQNLLVTGTATLNPSVQDAFFVINGRLNIVADVSFFRGDANADETLDISDPIHLLAHLFLGGRAPACADAADANDDGRLDISDAVTALDYLFRGAGLLPPPVFPACGQDPTHDALRCAGGGGCV